MAAALVERVSSGKVKRLLWGLSMLAGLVFLAISVLGLRHHAHQWALGALTVDVGCAGGDLVWLVW